MQNSVLTLLMKIPRYCAKRYYKIFRPTTVGVRAIVINEEGKFLLVKHRDDQIWYLPGGGVKSRETLLQAIQRELSEEIGAIDYTNSNIELFNTYSSFYEGKNDYISVFIIKNILFEITYNLEIDEVQIFDISNLPKAISAGSARRLNEYNDKQTIKSDLW